MRLGKTKQTIDAAQVLFERGEVDTVIVVAPAPVRDTWFDPEIGEVAKHRWPGLPTFVMEYQSSKRREWTADYVDGQRFLRWVVTNYEFIRHRVRHMGRGRWWGPNLEPLLAVQKGMLVLDESSAVSNYQSLQSRACSAIRQRCSRVVLLNGTPYGENAEDIYSQARLMDEEILKVNHISQFRARYAVMGGYMVEVIRYGKKMKVATEVLGWRHQKRPGCCDIPPHIISPIHDATKPGLEEIQARMAPYVIRRLKADCLDLPPKLEPVTLTAVLTPETWKVYKAMRDETVAWLDRQSAAVSLQSGVKVMRLAQITSGFVGGVKDMEASCPECGGSGLRRDQREGPPLPQAPAADPELLLDPSFASPACPACQGEGMLPLSVPPRVVGREKLDVLMGWIQQRLRADHDMQMLVWCHFRPELDRIVKEASMLDGLTVRGIYGGQKRDERQEALRLMHPDAPREKPGPAILAGTLGTGSQGLTMTRAHEEVFASQDYSLLKRQQAEDRPHGPGQTQPISIHDIVAVGPNGQQTVDHVIVAKQRAKHDLAHWTTSAWVEALTKE